MSSYLCQMIEFSFNNLHSIQMTELKPLSFKFESIFSHPRTLQNLSNTSHSS